MQGVVAVKKWLMRVDPHEFHNALASTYEVTFVMFIFQARESGFQARKRPRPQNFKHVIRAQNFKHVTRPQNFKHVSD